MNQDELDYLCAEKAILKKTNGQIFNIRVEIQGQNRILFRHNPNGNNPDLEANDIIICWDKTPNQQNFEVLNIISQGNGDCILFVRDMLYSIPLQQPPQPQQHSSNNGQVINNSGTMNIGTINSGTIINNGPNDNGSSVTERLWQFLKSLFKKLITKN